ncbi:MAG: AtzH-like domain-containing protein [Pseudomonadota bacterium]
MAFDAGQVEAEILAAFRTYEAALGANDTDILAELFWDDPRVARMTAEGGLYGPGEIAAFRKGRDTADLGRTLSEIRVVALSADIGVATCEYVRTGSERRGAQSQVWMRTDAGWRIASAHVSLGPAPG